MKCLDCGGYFTVTEADASYVRCADCEDARGAWGWSALAVLAFVALVALALSAVPGCDGRPVDVVQPADAGADAAIPDGCYAEACAYCNRHVLTGHAVPVQRQGALWCDPPAGPAADAVDCSTCVGGER